MDALHAVSDLYDHRRRMNQRMIDLFFALAPDSVTFSVTGSCASCGTFIPYAAAQWCQSCAVKLLRIEVQNMEKLIDTTPESPVLLNAEKVVVNAALRWDAADRDEHWANGHTRPHAEAVLREATGQMRTAIDALQELKRALRDAKPSDATGGP
jgi:hypothetical protein